VPLYLGDTTGPHLERLNGGSNGTTDETEGVFNGYRFFDKEGITPLFPFGWGLSYSRFSYSDLGVSRARDGGLDVSFRVRNTGPVTGAAVPQVYLGAPSRQPAGVEFAVRQLSQFDRVVLAPGQSQWVSLEVPLRQLQYWSATYQQWLVASGRRTVYVGDADSPMRLPLRASVDIPSRSDVTCVDQQLSATMIAGQLTVPRGAWCDLVDVSVARDLTISGTGVRVAGSTIGGSVNVFRVRDAADPLSAGTNVICNTTIGGNLVIRRSSSGAPWNIGQCGPDTIRGDLVFAGNRAEGTSIAGNTIVRNLVCVRNRTVGDSDNTVIGRIEGDCTR
jgi:Fibronectin type III-like domain